MPKRPDGLLIIPYTTQDWIVLSVAVAGTMFKIILLYENEEEPNPKVRDYISIFLTSYIVTIGLYELAIIKEWSIQVFYIPFAIAIISAKDIGDWLFMSDEGKKFLRGTLLTLLEKIIKPRKDEEDTD